MPSSRQRALSREIILSTALDLVDEEGLSALSLRSLGKRLGVSQAAFYRHFPDKAALLEGIAEQVWRLTFESFLDRVDAGFGPLQMGSFAPRVLEVSHRRLAPEAARAAGAHGARMTGGGFGGSAIALVDAKTVHDVAAAVAQAYEREGFNPPAFLDAVPAAPAGRLP